MNRILLPSILGCLLVLTGCSIATPEPDVSTDRGLTAPPAGAAGLGAEAPQSTGIILGESHDEQGQLHQLVLNLAPDVSTVVTQSDNLFAVVSGGSRYSVTGDVAMDAWRFAVDSQATGDTAPIIVIKDAPGSVQELAKNPTRFAAPGGLNENAGEASTRLGELITAVISKSEHPSTGGVSYESLAQKLQDPAWNGVLIFNASVSALPDDVQGHSTAPLADAQLIAYAIGFETPPLSETLASSFFGTIDHPRNTDGSQSVGQYLRADFANSTLKSFTMGEG